MDESGAWQSVRGATYPTEPDRWHEVKFQAVTTRALRATIHGQKNGAYFHSVLVSEFEVHGVQAKQLPSLDVAMANGRPELPTSLDLEFPGAGILPVKLLWRDLPAGNGESIAEARAIGQAATCIRARLKD